MPDLTRALLGGQLVLGALLAALWVVLVPRTGPEAPASGDPLVAVLTMPVGAVAGLLVARRPGSRPLRRLAALLVGALLGGALTGLPGLLGVGPGVRAPGVLLLQATVAALVVFVGLVVDGLLTSAAARPGRATAARPPGPPGLSDRP